MSLKFTGELCAITMMNDAKTEDELTCQFKIDMINLTNFEKSKVSKIYTLMAAFDQSIQIFELKMYRGVVFHDTRV